MPTTKKKCPSNRVKNQDPNRSYIYEQMPAPKTTSNTKKMIYANLKEVKKLLSKNTDIEMFKQLLKGNKNN